MVKQLLAKLLVSGLVALAFGCGHLPLVRPLPAGSELVMRPSNERTDFILVKGVEAIALKKLLDETLRPLEYRSVATRTVSSSKCAYELSEVAPTAPPILGDCTPKMPETCYEMKESIRAAIFSRAEVEMKTQICAARSLMREGVIIELVYGEQKKWSGTSRSVNAQADFLRLKERLAESFGSAQIGYLRRWIDN